MSGRIVGITKTSLWNAWKSIRKQLNRTFLRDVIDFLEYDIDPDIWINRLLRQIANGSYEPNLPRRFTIAKSRGFSRRMTMPDIPDIVLYRSIVDHLYRRMKRYQREHVYFEREDLTKLRKESKSQIDSDIYEELTGYNIKTISAFLAWLHYDQYRRYLIFKKVYPYIVTTDITNFFDSILYSRISEVLHNIPVPSGMVGLLFFILEKLSIRDTYTESPRIGIPVDEFDCSRKLAHIVLFAHDDRIVTKIGEDAYVRWMDDQNIGVSSHANGLKILSDIGNSLSRLHLTPNAEKSRVLSLSDARRYYHLDLNSMLDNLEKLPFSNAAERKVIGSEIRKVWSKAKNLEGKGEWSKILKRIYRFAGLSQIHMLRPYAIRHLLNYPTLAQRIADYMRCTNTVSDYLDFVTKVWQHEEQIYPDVNHILVESLLRLEAIEDDASQIRKIASALLLKRSNIVGASESMSIAPLLILRFGDRRSLGILRKCFEGQCDNLPSDVVRATAIVYASYGLKELDIVLRALSRLLRGHMAELSRLIARIGAYDEVPQRYKNRLRIRHDAVAGQKFLDMRSLVTARLLALNPNKNVQSWILMWREDLLKQNISLYDKKLLARLIDLDESRSLELGI